MKSNIKVYKKSFADEETKIPKLINTNLKSKTNVKLNLEDRVIKKMISILKNEGVNKISIFGSFARNQAGKNSDIDILVNFSRKMSYFEFVNIEDRLSNLIGRKVDLLTEKSISPYIISNIKKDEVILYESK